MPEIEKTEIEEVKNLFAQLTTKNDEKFAEIKKKGVADSLLVEQTKTMADELSKKLELMQSKMIQPSGKDILPDENVKRMNLITKSYGRSGNFTTESLDLYGKAFEKFLRTGSDRSLSPDQFKTLQEGLDAQGGYTVRTQYSNTIIKKIFETSPMRQYASIENISSDKFEYLVDFDDFDAEYVKELRTQSVTDNAEFYKKGIEVHEISAKPKASLRLLEDSVVNIESWIANKLADKFSRLDNNNFINGNGVGKPKGILDYADGSVYGTVEQVESTVSGTLVANDMLQLLKPLKDEYASRATIFMSRQALYTMLQNLGGDGHNIIDLFNRPTTDGKIPLSILGLPVQFMQDMPTTIAGGTLAVAVGDWKKAYTIVDRVGISILRDPYSADGAVIYKTRMRTGGDVVNTEAYKILKIKA